MAMAAVVLVYQKTDKAKKLRFIFWPAIDAFSNNFSASPQLILSKLTAKAPLQIRTNFINHIKNSLGAFAENFTLSAANRVTW